MDAVVTEPTFGLGAGAKMELVRTKEDLLLLVILAR